MSAKKPVILHLIPTLGPGGSEKYLLDLVRNTNRDEFDVHVCVLSGVIAFPERWNEVAGITVLGAAPSWSNPVSMVSFWRKARAVIARIEPDVVHSHLWLAHRMAMIAVAGRNIGHLLHIHECWVRLESSTVRDRVMRALMNLALRRERTRFVAVSEDTLRYSSDRLAVLAGRIHTIANGVDTQHFAPPAGGKVRRGRVSELSVASVGWFSGAKGQDLLIRASALLRDKGLTLRLVLAGEGKCLAAYKQLADQLDVGDRVVFPGLVEDVRLVLHACDVFALPSRSEGLPLALLEAMACGLPAVVSRAGGMSEAVCHNNNGILLDELTAQHLACVFVRLFDDTSLICAMSKAARRTAVETFSLQRNVREIQRTYRELLWHGHESRIWRPGNPQPPQGQE